MFARRTGTRRTPVSARMLASSAVAANNYSPLRPTAAPRRAGHTPVHARASGHAPLRAASERARARHTPVHARASGHAPLRAASERARARHPGGRPDAHAIQRPSPVSPRTTRSMRARRCRKAPGAHATADWQGEAIDNEHVARGEHLPQHVRNPGHPIGELMQTTIEARDADPPRQRSQRAHHRRRPFVMTANIRGGDDRNRQNLGVGDLRPHITAMPQAFHQRVNHDKSGYNPRGVYRLLLAMMLVQQPRSCLRCRWSSTSNQGIMSGHC